MEDTKLYSVKEISAITGKTEKNVNNILRLHPEIPRIRKQVKVSRNGGGPLRNFVDDAGLNMIKSINRSNSAKNNKKLNEGRDRYFRENKNKKNKKPVRSYTFKSSDYSRYWKVSVFDESSGHFFVKHCSLTYAQARIMQNTYIKEDKICRVTPH